MKYLILFTTLLCFQASAQNPLEAFSNIAGSSWISEGKQLGGHEGKTVFEVEWGLDGKLVNVKTSTTDPETLEFGPRNEGVRFFNKDTETLEFYEFDKLGSVSRGEIIIDGNDIHYQYEYGDLLLRDSWIYVHEDEYQFVVGSINEGDWETIYHQSKITRLKN